MKEIRTVALLLAGGSGMRAGGKIPKQERMIAGKSMLRRAAEAFENAEKIDGFYIVARSDEEEFVSREAADMKKYIGFVCGGKTRAESAKAGFSMLAHGAKTVVIHDVARPLILSSDVDKVVCEAEISGAAIAVLPIYDTVKETDKNGRILKTVPREGLVRAATPQAFSVENYKKALTHYSPEVTDDAALAELAGITVTAVPVEKKALKITTNEDFLLAEYLIAEGGK